MIEKVIIKGIPYPRSIDVDYQAMELHTFPVYHIEDVGILLTPYPSLPILQETCLAGCFDPYLEIALYVFIH